MAEAVNGSTHYVSGRAIDALRPLKVIIIGAGVSGILSTIRLRETCSPLQIVVYEKNAEVGGTWYENHYPGLACGTLFDANLILLAAIDLLLRHPCSHLSTLVRVKPQVVQVLRSWPRDFGVLEACRGQVLYQKIHELLPRCGGSPLERDREPMAPDNPRERERDNQV